MRRQMPSPYQHNTDGNDPAVADTHTYIVELAPYQRVELLSIMRSRTTTTVTKSIIEALELAERVDLVALRNPRTDWDRRERWAQAGYSLIDQLFDGFKAKGDPK